MNSRRSSAKLTLSQMRQSPSLLWLLGYELDECGDDTVELVVQARVLLNVAAHNCDFHARECFAG